MASTVVKIVFRILNSLRNIYGAPTVPGTVVGPGNASMNKTDMVSVLLVALTVYRRDNLLNQQLT